MKPFQAGFVVGPTVICSVEFPFLEWLQIPWKPLLLPYFSGSVVDNNQGPNGKPRRSTSIERPSPASPQRAGLGKRKRAEESRVPNGRRSTTSSRSRSPAPKRQCQPQPPILPPRIMYKLCKDCSKICWDEIETMARQKLRFTWKGRPVCDVGRRYRTLSPDNDCTLCQQLHAPWIEKFLDNMRWMERKVIPDKGDRIHVFPNLQYIPHISHFQSGRNVLRLHDVPFHIAVVPIAPKWKAGMLEHMAKNGMVVVLDDRCPASRILQPQEIPRRSEPKPVLSWLKTCKSGHKKR
ncbi:hypothetical protein V8F33_011868 [Rhypophila sp. PSN 637]